MFVETKLRDDLDIQYKNWNIIKHIGEKDLRARGGSLIKCHPSLKMGKENPPSINNKKNETLHFTLPFKNDKIHVFLVYIHPWSKIEESIFIKAAQYKYSLIIGDFNVNKTKNKQINEFLKNNHFEKVLTPPTFLMDNNQDSTPDIILHSANLKDNIKKVELTTDLGSDHLAILVDFDFEATPIEEPKTVSYNYSKSNIKQINRRMEEFIEERKQLEIDILHIETFNEYLSETIKSNTPMIPHKNYHQELPPYIVKLIKNKRKIYRDYCINKDPMHKRKLNQYNKNIQKMIHQYKEHKWISACEKINATKGKSFYKEVNKLSKYKTYNKIPSLIENGKTFQKDEEKVKLFAEHYEKAFDYENNDEYDKDHENEVNKWYDKCFSTMEEEDPMCKDEVKIEEDLYLSIINGSKNSAPGKDHIPWKIIKQLSRKVHKHLIKIYQYCLDQKIFPSIWKEGVIITIPKTNLNHSRTANYRPITLLPVLGKIYEKIIREILNKYIENLIPITQFGFQNGKSTIHPLSILVSNTQNAMMQKFKTAAISLDINKAFDSVWHKGLLYKLHRLKIPRFLLLIIKNFLENRRLCVKINNKTSNAFTPKQGTPQGSPLSPILYNIYCGDIFEPRALSSKQYILQYADDTLIISHGENMEKCIINLQELMDKTEIWFRIWRLKPNPEKSQFIIFGHKPSPSSPIVKVCNQHKTIQQSIKYLGVHIDQKLNFNQHTYLMKKKAISRAKCFSKLVIRNQGLTMKNAKKIYTSICRPILEYAHPILMNCRNPAIKNLEVAERTALRSISRLRHPINRLYNPPNQLLYTSTNIEPISTRLQKLNKKFYSRLRNMEDILHLYHDDGNSRTKRKFPKASLIQEMRSAYNNTNI